MTGAYYCLQIMWVGKFNIVTLTFRKILDVVPDKIVLHT